MASRRLSSVDEEAKFREKHQVLLQEYLVLQKECVSKKRKLKEAKERKQTLLDEVRFLRQRRKFIFKSQSQNLERQQNVIQPQKPDAKYDAGPSGRYVNASEPVFQNSQPTMGSLWNSGTIDKEKVGFGSLRIGKKPKTFIKEEVGIEPLRIGKKPKNLFPNGKRAEKRKITWHDHLALKV